MNSKVTLVDGEEWYRLNVSTEVLQWLKTQDNANWYEHRAAAWFPYTVDITSEILTMITLKFNRNDYKVL